MSGLIVKSFCDELMKLAFDVPEALKMMKALKPRQLRVGTRYGIGVGASAPRKFLAKADAATMKGLQEVGGLSPELAAKVPTAIRRKMQEQTGLAPHLWMQKQPYMFTPEKGDVLSWVQGGMKGTPIAKFSPEAVKPLQRVSSIVRTPEERIMFEGVMKGHEGAELAAMKRPMMAMRGMGHLSPEVILKEHNMVTTMPPMLRKKIAPTYRVLRGPAGQGEADFLRNVTGGRFQYGKSPRLSRHARKRIAELAEQAVQPQAQYEYRQLAAAARQGAFD